MHRITCSLLAATLLFLGTTASSKEDAEAVDPKYTWDLTEIYPTVEAWEQARDQTMQDFEKLEERRRSSSGVPIHERIQPGCADARRQNPRRSLSLD